MKTSITKNKKRIYGVFALIFWIALWQIGAMLVGREVLLPTPLAVLGTLWRLLPQDMFWSSILHSVLRIMAGFLAALLTASAFAALCYRSHFLTALFAPALQVIKSTPVASFIILAMVWLPSGKTPTFIAFLMVLPLVFSAVLNALCEVPADLLEMAKAYRFDRLKIIRTIYLPAVLPSFVTAAATALGFAWKSGVAAEVLARPQAAIGTALYDAKIYLEMPELFSFTLVIILLSILIERIFLLLVNKSVKKMKLQMEVEA